jgi:hypothetical protein
MEIVLSVLQSANIVAIGAFLLTTIFLSYEIYLLIRQKKQNDKPIIPDFKTGVDYGHPKAININVESLNKGNILKTPNEKLIIVLVIILIIFIIAAIMSIISKIEEEEKAIMEKRKKVNVVKSNGIIIYNKDWEQLKEEDLKKLRPGDLIKVSIAIISKTDIDKARIKINRNSWDKDESQIVFDKNRNLFYKEYKVASSDAKLSIEAQFHSIKEGWLNGNEQKK